MSEIGQYSGTLYIAKPSLAQVIGRHQADNGCGDALTTPDTIEISEDSLCGLKNLLRILKGLQFFKFKPHQGRGQCRQHSRGIVGGQYSL